MKNAVIFDRKFFKFIPVGVINTIVGSALRGLNYLGQRLVVFKSKGEK